MEPISRPTLLDRLEDRRVQICAKGQESNVEIINDLGKAIISTVRLHPDREGIHSHISLYTLSVISR